MLAAAASTARATDTLAVAPCPCCGGGSALVLYRAASIPIHSSVLLDSAEDARALPRRDLQLAFCSDCGFLYNDIFDEAAIAYSGDFEESQHFSRTFSTFARRLVADIDAKCQLAGKRVLEIGCGKGDFLVELCAHTGATGVGIDPGYRRDAHREPTANVSFIADYCGPKYADIAADVVICRHTLEHIPHADGFLHMVRAAIGDRPDVWVVFETPDAERVMREGAFWDIYYEHCSYFSAGTHARAFRRAGFEVTDISLVYDGQYLLQYARPARHTQTKLPGENDLPRLRALAEDFPGKLRAAQNYWVQRIRQAAAEGKSVALWGGGSKAVAFLTALNFPDDVVAVVDVNTRKQGKFVPGTGHEVIAPAELDRIRPDIVLLMNRIYRAEVAKDLERLGLEPEVLALGASGAWA